MSLTSIFAAASAVPVAAPRFVALLQSSLAQQRFIKLVLAKPRAAAQGVLRVVVRAVLIKGAPHLSFVSSHATKDITQNLPPQAAVEAVQALLPDAFAHAHLFCTDEEVQLLVSKKGRQTVLRSARAASDEAAVSEGAHNREKHRFVEQTRPFLVALGVTDAQHQVIPAMQRKWKQINKFVEIFAGAVAAAPLKQDAPLQVVDFGSGKAYLTFAVHDHLQHTLGRAARVTGVELRHDLVQLCQGVVKRLGLQGIAFDEGDVRSYQPGSIDVVIALHACDVATDHAIHLGVRAGAAVILCSPCCHKELRPQLLSPHPIAPILQHGVHLGQQAEMLTDGLRAMLLEACGYETQVFEFVALEHTNKNKMILAVKRGPDGLGKRGPAQPAAEVMAQVADVAAFYGIKAQCLERLLRADGLLPADG
jgi:hypothetical protein